MAALVDGAGAHGALLLHLKLLDDKLQGAATLVLLSRQYLHEANRRRFFLCMHERTTAELSKEACRPMVWPVFLQY
jgi:hypothetical protein